MSELSFEREVAICRMLLDYIQDGVEDLDDESFFETRIPGSVTPAWLLGHLALEADNTAVNIGSDSRFPGELRKWFVQGTLASDVPTSLGKQVLVGLLDACYGGLIAQLKTAGIGVLKSPNPSKILCAYFPEIQHDVSHILTGHLAIHAGHLGMWRKLDGRKNKYGK